MIASQGIVRRMHVARNSCLIIRGHLTLLPFILCRRLLHGYVTSIFVLVLLQLLILQPHHPRLKRHITFVSVVVIKY